MEAVIGARERLMVAQARRGPRQDIAGGGLTEWNAPQSRLSLRREQLETRK